MDDKYKLKKNELVWFFAFTIIFFAWDMGFFFNHKVIIPVQGATRQDWNHATFWQQPWGISGVHKGVDIFAPRGRPALAAVSGLIVYQGESQLGGKVLMIFDPKIRLHYYAHLDSVLVNVGDWVAQGSVVGKVGNTGNARGRPVHLHYSIMTLIPYLHRFSLKTQGWKLMFYLNPTDYLH